MTRKLLSALSRIGYISRIRSGRENMVVLGDAGLRYFSSKDRVQLRDMRTDWGLSSDAGSGVLSVDDITGVKLRLLASQARHTAELYETVALLTEGCRGRDDIDLLEIVPPDRSERWIPIGRVLRGGRRRHFGVRPDSAGVASVASGIVRPFMLEYERRATSPQKMYERLRPYRNYYETVLTSEGWEAGFITLVVFDDRGTAGRFVQFCHEHPFVSQIGGWSPMPVFVSSLQDLRSVGAAGACWMHGSRLRRGAMTLAEAVGLRRA